MPADETDAGRPAEQGGTPRPSPSDRAPHDATGATNASGDAAPAPGGSAHDDRERAASSEDPHLLDIVIVVHVVRTGGLAGLTREWTAEPPSVDAPHWDSLIEECPWDAVAQPQPVRGADRFAWRISARRADDPPRRAELADGDLRGPWRALVDEVRSFDAPPGRDATRG